MYFIFLRIFVSFEEQFYVSKEILIKSIVSNQYDKI